MKINTTTASRSSHLVACCFLRPWKCIYHTSDILGYGLFVYPYSSACKKNLARVDDGVYCGDEGYYVADGELDTGE